MSCKVSSSQTRVLVTLGWVVLSAVARAAYPQGDPLINAAADQINILTPQAVPDQRSA